MAFHNLYFFSQTQKKQMGYIITSNSDPLYDGWGWDDYWSAEDWVRWHKALKTDLGKTEADNVFVEAFVNPTISTPPYAHSNYVRFNSFFRNYVKSEKIYNRLVTNSMDKAVIATVNTYDSAANIVTNLVDTTEEAVGDTTSGIANVSNLIKYGLPVLVILAIYLGYKFLLNTNLAKAL